MVQIAALFPDILSFIVGSLLFRIIDVDVLVDIDIDVKIT